jgi:hypothetical protein
MGLLMDPFGVWHLVDRVGLTHYPYPADILEEGRVYGFSRRVQKNLGVYLKEGKRVKPGTKGGAFVSGFSLLTAKSRLLLVHDRAYLVNWSQYQEEWPVHPLEGGGTVEGWACPKGYHAHDPALIQPDSAPCAGLYWEDLPRPGQDSPDPWKQGKQYYRDQHAAPRDVERVLPSLTYSARMRPEGVTPLYGGPAIFASLPITRLVQVAGDAGPCANLGTGTVPFFLVTQ